ncbi:MAG: transcriptional regulator GutM [Oscillibacter sp.]|nr:transcriptional regulator GutM [Oscillibacter sp.]
MLKLGLFVAAMFLIQAFLTSLQISHFNQEFIKLRRRGKVACGRQSGGFHAGAIVLFLIDENGTIREGKTLTGVTSFARVKPLPGFEGKFVGGLTEADLPRHGKNLRKAILDAKDTYNKVMNGEIVPDKPSPFQRAGRALTGRAT